MGLSPAQKDFCDYYGVTYPAEAMYRLYQQGKTYDLRGDYGQSIGAFIVWPNDIKRIIDATVAIFTRAEPRLANAKTDAEFRQIQQEVLAEAKNVGEDRVWQWVSEEYARLEKIVVPVFKEVQAVFNNKKK
jgi:hypothetical protein